MDNGNMYFVAMKGKNYLLSQKIGQTQFRGIITAYSILLCIIHWNSESQSKSNIIFIGGIEKNGKEFKKGKFKEVGGN